MSAARRRAALAAGLLAAAAACFGSVSEPARHYYTLNLQPLRGATGARLPGLLRVRDLDADSAYDRFQMVLRRSPFELTYRQRDVWAVKPNRMVSDLLARGLGDQHVFVSVAREYGERRPDYLLSGELQAIEIDGSGGGWAAHLALALQITEFETGRVIWTFQRDARRPVPPQDFARAVRALSELTTDAVDGAVASLRALPAGEASAAAAASEPPPAAAGAAPGAAPEAAPEPPTPAAPPPAPR